MGKMFNNLSWNAKEGENSLKMTKEDFKAALENTRESLNSFLRGIVSVPQGLIIPVFITSGLESMIQYAIKEKEPSFMALPADEVTGIVAPIYTTLDTYLVEFAKFENQDKAIPVEKYSDLIAYNDRYVETVFKKYLPEQYGNISAVLLDSQLDTFIIKAYVIGLINYLKAIKEEDSFMTYMGLGFAGMHTSLKMEQFSSVMRMFGIENEVLYQENLSANEFYAQFNW